MPLNVCANTKLNKRATRQQCFCSATHFLHPNPTSPPGHMRSFTVGSCCHLRPGPGLACVLLTPDSRADPTQPAGCTGGGGRSATAGVGDVGMSRRMGGLMERRKGHVTPELDDHVGVNAVTVIITAYMVKMLESADAEGSRSRCGKA